MKINYLAAIAIAAVITVGFSTISTIRNGSQSLVSQTSRSN